MSMQLNRCTPIKTGIFWIQWCSGPYAGRGSGGSDEPPLFVGIQLLTIIKLCRNTGSFTSCPAHFTWISYNVQQSHPGNRWTMLGLWCRKRRSSTASDRVHMYTHFIYSTCSAICQQTPLSNILHTGLMLTMGFHYTCAQRCIAAGNWRRCIGFTLPCIKNFKYWLSDTKAYSIFNIRNPVYRGDMLYIINQLTHYYI